MTLRWKIWYGDKSSFSNLDGEPEESPGWDVQVIVQVCESTGRWNESLCDYYVWHVAVGQWLGMDIAGLLHYLGQPGWKVVRIGSRIPDDVFQEIMSMAERDESFPPRSAFRPGEKQPGT